MITGANSIMPGHRERQTARRHLGGGLHRSYFAHLVDARIEAGSRQFGMVYDYQSSASKSDGRRLRWLAKSASSSALLKVIAVYVCVQGCVPLSRKMKNY
ncbi:MAG: hypothetical protein ACYDD1_12990 [Caulobacteraceae bacterium]